MPITVIKDVIISETNSPNQLLQKKWVIKENDNNKNSLSLFDVTKDQKFYLKSHKRYTLTDLYNEWITKQNSVYKNIRESKSSYPGQFMLIDTYTNAFWFSDFQQTNATISSEDLILERKPESWEDALIIFFHEKFYNALNIKDYNILTHDGEYTFDNEKHFYVVNWKRHGIKLSIDDPGLYFKTPNLMKIVCKQITMIKDDNQYPQVMVVTAIDEEDKFKHKEFKFSGEETFQLKSNVSNHIEILLLDEN